MMDLKSLIREEVENAHYKWITIAQKGDTGKTKLFDVVAKEGAIALGEVKWFARWRKYAFFPAAGTVFEQDCLNDISSFLEKLKAERKKP